ncbi:uncharacterized protein LOC115441178 isoform X1 [Manduca sexta]|uniref:uncharacterized protein LOC115441178 isoform X1 n=1 Tax=Manduca sexta TaxID=7130 RepID=UPI001182E179|nr:uncharacterized protein LOC115441178 isoform X1 [Manduca sexta]
MTPTGSKISSIPSTSFSKTYITPSISTPKNSKAPSGFGIIWLPGRRHNKKKDVVWNPHNYDGSKERAPSMYSFMSGDSQAYKKKEEEIDLLASDKNKSPVAMNVGTVVAVADAASDTKELENPEDKQGFAKYERTESKEAAGDTNNDQDSNSSNKDYLENKGGTNTYTEPAEGKGTDYGDKVDSVYLKPSSPSKARSTASAEDDDCGIKCLYYTLQCCECVLI